MKLKFTLLAALLCFAGNSQAQTLGDIPTVPLAQERIGVSVGALMSGGSTFRNSEIVDFTFAKGLFVGAEITAASASANVLDSASLRGGFSKTWDKARAHGFLGGRRNWESQKWEGIGGVGLAYTPLTNGVMQNFSLVTEQRILVTNKKDAPPTETFFGIRYSF